MSVIMQITNIFITYSSFADRFATSVTPALFDAAGAHLLVQISTNNKSFAVVCLNVRIFIAY